MDKEPSEIDEIDEKELEKISGGDDHMNRIVSIVHQVAERYGIVTAVTSMHMQEFEKLNEQVFKPLIEK